jgi:hypothetical protein
MAWCKARPRELGAPAIGRTVNAESVPAIRLYEKTGSKKVEKRIIGEKCPTDKAQKPSSSLLSNTDPLPTAIQQQ